MPDLNKRENENRAISIEGILPYLNDKARAQRILIFDSLESTNETAKTMAESAGHGALIVSEGQTMGKGRFNRSFFSPFGTGVYMSVILDLDKTGISEPTLLPLFAASSACGAIEAAFGVNAKVKWVNDIMAGERKAGGILCEAVLAPGSNRISSAIVGIGINASTPLEAFPEELRGTAGSLCPGQDIDRSRLVAEILNRLLVETNAGAIVNDYKGRLMTLDRMIEVLDPKGPYEAFALDIDDLGHLIVKLGDGSQRTLVSGEISIKMRE